MMTRALTVVSKSVRYVLLLLILLNIRSFPLNWHIRVFRPVLYLRLKWLSLRLLASKKQQTQWLDSLSPLGKSPFDVKLVYKNWASIDDSDYNMHLSNSSYAKTLDMTRLRFALRAFPSFFRDGGWCALGATNYHFIREIPIGASYEVRMYIGSWDNKWVYLIGRFVSKKKKGSASTTKQLNGPPSPATQQIPLPSLHTPSIPEATNSATPSGYSTPQKTSNSDSSIWQEGPDEILHCVSVSQLCFKVGRVTVPSNLALATCGLGEVSKEKWEELRSLRGESESASAKDSGQKKIKELLRGAWKDVPEGSRWWDVALQSCETDRLARLEVVKKLREGLEAVRSL